jgi:hypothetical protein
MIRNLVLASVFIAAPVAWAAASEVLYDRTQTTFGGGVGSNDQVGQIVQLPFQSAITKFTFTAESGPVFGLTDDVIVRFYRVTDLNGLPKDLLWSGQLDDLHFTRTRTQYSINVPNVELPRTFAATIDLATSQFSILLNAGTNANPVGKSGSWVYRLQNSWFAEPNAFSLGFRVEGISSGMIQGRVCRSPHSVTPAHVIRPNAPIRVSPIDGSNRATEFQPSLHVPQLATSARLFDLLNIMRSRVSALYIPAAF